MITSRSLLLTGGCNRERQSLTWSSATLSNNKSYIAYGCHNLICLVDPLIPTVKYALKGHTSYVTCVQTFQYQEQLLVISGSKDQTIRVWLCDPLNDLYQSISCFNVGGDVIELDIQSSGEYLFIGVITMSRQFKLFKSSFQSSHSFELIKEITYVPRSRPVTITLSSTIFHERNVLIIALGHVDSKVRLYVTSCALSSNDTYSDVIEVVTLSGHEDWVRSITLMQVANDTTIRSNAVTLSSPTELTWLIGSASQDKSIRLWKWEWSDISTSTNVDDSKPLHVHSLGSGGYQISYYPIFDSIILLDSLLIGHEHWVLDLKLGVQSPSLTSLPSIKDVLVLSCSMDNAVIVWKYIEDANASMWNIVSRLGEVNLTLHSVGIFGASFSPNCDAIIAHGFTGSMQCWKLQQQQSSSSSSSQTTDINQFSYLPSSFVSGSSNSVQDCCWSNSKQPYLITVSSDQTTRIFAPWQRTQSTSSSSSPLTCDPHNPWVEIARPQIHGYDLNCVSILPDHRFVSAADEKVLRVFIAPQPFLTTLHQITQTIAPADELTIKRSLRAHLPELGLSNRALNEGDNVATLNGSAAVETSMMAGEDNEDGEAGDIDASNPLIVSTEACQFSEPPNDVELASLTLWSEQEKIFGLSQDAVSLASSSNGQWVAAAAQATNPSDATICVSSSITGNLRARISGHVNSVSCLKFSHDCRWLLAGSKDRHFTLTNLTSLGSAESNIDVIDLTPSARLSCHSRIIWSCSFSPDDLLFATASRDRSVKIFSFNSQTGEHSCIQSISKLPNAVTAIDFAPCQNGYEIAVGESDGRITIWRSTNELIQFTMIHEIDTRLTPCASIRRLAYHAYDLQTILLAVASEDHMIRIFEII